MTGAILGGVLSLAMALPTHAQTPHSGRTTSAVEQPGSRDTTINAAVNFPDVASLTRYLNNSERYWVFYVDDVTGMSISFGAWPRGGGPVHDASPDQAAGRPTTISVTPPSDSAATPPERPEAGDGSASKDAREQRQTRLGSGIRDVDVAPGPRGVRLLFHLDRRARVRVQFSKEAPRWNGREGRWEYEGGRAGPWFASIERAVGTTEYVAIPTTGSSPVLGTTT